MVDHNVQDAIKLDRNTILSYDRTRLSYERTMLAWVRTATSLITFGFAIYSFHRITTRDQSSYVIGSHQFGLMMVIIGFVALLLATFDYRHNIRVLSTQYPDLPRSRLPAALGLLISALGVLALIVMVFRQ